jgi:S-DNA-T family DNA segregation ATPase FtsK/SpoIIIE
MVQKKTTSSSRDRTNPQENQTWSGRALNIWVRFERFAWDVGGISLLAISVMTVLALILPQLTGGDLILWWIGVLRRWFGWGSLFVILVLGVLGLVMLRRRMEDLPVVRWRRVFALETAAFSALTLMTLLGEGTLDRAEAGFEGGLVGWGLAELLGIFLPQVVVIFVLIILFLVGLIIGLGLEGWLSQSTKRLLLGETTTDIEALTEPAISVAPAQGGGSKKASSGSSKQPKTQVAPEFRKQFRIEPQDERPATPLNRGENLPPLSILTMEKDSRLDERHINQRAGLIEQTLSEFGVPVKVISFQVGPTVTQFAVEPGFIEKSGASD